MWTLLKARTTTVASVEPLAGLHTQDWVCLTQQPMQDFLFFYFCIWLLSHLLVNNKAGLKRDSPTVREAIAAINLIKTIDRVKQQSVECRAPWCIHPLYSLRDMLIRGWVFTRCVSLPTCIHRLKMAHLWHIGPDDNLKRTRFVAKKPRLQKPFPAGCRPALSDREWRAHQA